MATLKDVAKLACVDVSTVSRALNNSSYVHPDTRARVFEAARTLGYRPNAMAQALRQGRRHILGVVVPRLHLTIFSEILQGIEQEADKRGYTTMVCVTENDARVERDRLNRLRNGFVDGIIIASTGRNSRLLRDIRAEGIPLVQLVRNQDPSISSIVADYETSGYDAVRYLHSLGCRRIGIIDGAQNLAPYRLRREGYLRGMERCRLEPILSESRRQPNTFEYGYECAARLLDSNDGLDAIIASMDVQGLGALRLLSERGICVPDQVRVMSLTGHEVGAMLATSMTSMEMPAHEMGVKAVDMIVEQIEAPAGQKPSPQHLSFSSILVEREST